MQMLVGGLQTTQTNSPMLLALPQGPTRAAVYNVRSHFHPHDS